MRAEGVILVGMFPKKITPEADIELKELENLVAGAGGRVEQKVIQRRENPDPAFLIGKGKAEELSRLAEREGVRCVVFDADLTPTQQRNLEEVLDCKILDRTRLILDVFALRARTREGILQVELAQNKYLLPRLGGRGSQLMQQVGGIGARGPGERALEYDLRHIRAKIQHLQKELKRVVQERQTQRSRRLEQDLAKVAIVGYTNVGKSSLLNRLIAEHHGKDGNNEPIFADDRYFATLDPTTRRIYMDSGIPVLFTDTVGFIKNLPELLEVSFRATLEEIRWADLLLLASDPTEDLREIRLRDKAIEKILSDFEIQPANRIWIFTKADEAGEETRRRLSEEYPGRLWVSSKTGEGIPKLLKEVEFKLASSWPQEILTMRASEGHLLREIYSKGKVLEFKGNAKGNYKLVVQAPRKHLNQIKGKLRHLRAREGGL